MAITKDANVQAVVSKTVTINLADVTTGVDYEAMDLPPNSVIQSGDLYTTEAWNSTTSDVLDVGFKDFPFFLKLMVLLEALFYLSLHRTY